MIGETTPVRSTRMDGHDGFAQLLRSEWVKFWTVRAWVVSLVLAAVLTAGVTLALANASGSNGALPDVVTGPGGVAVNDNFYFMHRTLAGNGDITVRVTSLADGAFPGLGEGTLAAQPWAKAGIILKDGTQAGSAYAAVLATPGHGVRMQYDFTHDTAGLPGAVSVSSPRWLRLVRSGDTVTGYDSADGSHWTMIGSATLAGLGSSAQAGLFVASPWVSQNGNELVTQANARFDDLSLHGGWSSGGWGQCEVAASYLGGGVKGVARGCVQTTTQGIRIGSETESGGTFAVAGTGDISPYVPGWLLLACAVVTITVSSAVVAVEKCSSASCAADTTKVSLTGVQVGQAAVAILAVMVIGGEYATGMIRVTLAAVPRRSVMLAAKAAVVAVVTAAAGIIAVLGSLLAGRIFLPGNGFTVAHGFAPLSLGNGPTLRAAAGSVLYLVLVALLSLGVAAAARDTAIAIAIVLGLMYVLPAVSSLVLDPAWQHRVQRVAPMNAGLAIQSTTNLSKLPIGPWAGIGVLAAWTAAALLTGWLLLQLRDA